MRLNKLIKTNKSNIYTVLTRDGTTHYIAKFSYLGKNYGQRNLTKLFGANTLTQAFHKLQEIKIDLSQGNNPFEKITSNTFDSYFLVYLKTLKGQRNYSTTKYYEKHIKDVIGEMDISDIEEKHIQKILNTTLKNNSNTSKLELKHLLNPIFKKAIKKNLILHSPLDEMKFNKAKTKKDLSHRLVDNFQDTAKKLYSHILDMPVKKPEHLQDKLGLLICLMTARRSGETMQLKWEDILDGKVFVPEHISKTGSTDEFPLPIEILDILDELKKTRKKPDKIFSIQGYRLGVNFNKTVIDTKIRLSKGSKITLHDTRNLFISIMSPMTNNPPLVDRCLSHKQNSVMNIYLDHSYASRVGVFEQYWNILRK